MSGKTPSVASGGTIAHGLGVEPTTVVLTVENRLATVGTENILVWVRNLDETNITVQVVRIVAGVPTAWVENICWIAISRPADWPA